MKPPRVDRYAAWGAAPDVASPRLDYWRGRILNGWRPNRRIRAMGYDEAAGFFGVTIWEYVNVLHTLVHPVSPLSAS